ncbi:sentrin SUMO-specific, partial [Colletotrichum tofieldiae]
MPRITQQSSQRKLAPLLPLSTSSPPPIPLATDLGAAAPAVEVQQQEPALDANAHPKYYKFHAEVVNANPSPGTSTNRVVRQALGKFEQPLREAVAHKVIQTLPLAKATTKSVKNVIFDHAGKAAKRRSRYTAALDKAFGGRNWLPPPAFHRRAPAGPHGDTLAQNNLGQLCRLLDLCDEAGLPVGSWYTEGGLLYDASVALHGQGPLRWTADVPKKALELFSQRYPHVARGSRMGLVPHSSNTPPEPEPEPESEPEFAAGADVAKAGGEAWETEEDDQDQPIVSPTPTRLRRNCRKAAPRLSIVAENECTTESSRGLPLRVLYEAPDLGGMDGPDSTAANLSGMDPPSCSKISHSSPLFSPANDAHSPDMDFNFEESPDAPLLGLSAVDARLACRSAAMTQLENGEMLNDQSIRELQEIMKERIATSEEVVLVDPLYFKPTDRLPASLPRSIRNGEKAQLLAIIHHATHWVLARFRVVSQLGIEINVYDSIPTSGTASIVKKLAVPWLEKHFHGSKASFSPMAGPRQNDSTSCGLFVLVAMKHLLEGNDTLDNLQMDAAEARATLLDMAKKEMPFTEPAILLEPGNSSPRSSRHSSPDPFPNVSPNQFKTTEPVRRSRKRGAESDESISPKFKRRKSQGPRELSGIFLSHDHSKPDPNSAAVRRAKLDAIRKQIEELDDIPTTVAPTLQDEVGLGQEKVRKAEQARKEAETRLSAQQSELREAQAALARAERDNVQMREWTESLSTASSLHAPGRPSDGDSQPAPFPTFLQSWAAHQVFVQNMKSGTLANWNKASKDVEAAEAAVAASERDVGEAGAVLRDTREALEAAE